MELPPGNTYECACLSIQKFSVYIIIYSMFLNSSEVGVYAYAAAQVKKAMEVNIFC